MSPADGSTSDDLPAIHIDLNNAWGNDLFGIDTVGAIESFKKYSLVPHEGLRVKIFQENLAASAVIVMHQYNERPFLVAKLTEPLHEVPWDESE